MLGAVMVAVIVLSLFLDEVPLDEYFADWINISFWIAMGISFGFGMFFLISPKVWWAGLIAVFGIVALIVVSLIGIIVFGSFPLLPGANASLIALTSLFAMGSVGIAVGKTTSDKRHDACVPFFEDCSRRSEN